jgi:hypothetical protein
MAKEDQGSKQLSLNFAREEQDSKAVRPSDRHAERRSLLTVVVPTNYMVSCHREQQIADSEPDIYSREVTLALRAYANRLGW